MIKAKRQNVVYLTGWIIAAEWVEHQRLGEEVFSCTIRTDRMQYGGHHTVYFHGDLAQRLNMAIYVFMSDAPQFPSVDIEKVSFEEMDRYFLMVTVDGVLHFDDLFAIRVNCLNLTGQQRARVEDLLRDMRVRAWRT